MDSRHTTERSPETFEWVGGHLALDFANTVGDITSGDPKPYLHDYEDLLAWCQKADLIGPVGRRNLSAGSGRTKAAAFQESAALHGTLMTLFRAAARGERLPQKELDHLNALVHKTAAWRRISTCDDEDAGKKISCGWDFKDAPPLAVLGPIVWRAVELLESGPLDRIKECGAEDCRWLFLDTSKNRSRQWCSMQNCGNRTKVRRFREKNRA